MAGNRARRLRNWPLDGSGHFYNAAASAGAAAGVQLVPIGPHGSMTASASMQLPCGFNGMDWPGVRQQQPVSDGPRQRQRSVDSGVREWHRHALRWRRTQQSGQRAQCLHQRRQSRAVLPDLRCISCDGERGNRQRWRDESDFQPMAGDEFGRFRHAALFDFPVVHEPDNADRALGHRRHGGLDCPGRRRC